MPSLARSLLKCEEPARLEDAVEGLIHISELADKMVQHPREIVSEGEDVTVKIVRVDSERRRIGLSLKQADGPARDQIHGAGLAVGQAEHRVERPTLPSALAAKLTEAVSVSEQAAKLGQDGPTEPMLGETSETSAEAEDSGTGGGEASTMAEEEQSDGTMSGNLTEGASAVVAEESERATGETT